MNVPLLLSPEPAATPARVTLPGDIPVVQLRHHGATLAQLPDLFDSGYAVLAGLGPNGPGFAVYAGDISQSFDLTIGFPVASHPQSLPAGVESATFPSGEALLLSHLGPFEEMTGSWQRLVDAAEEQGLEVTSAIEVYVSDPSVTAPTDLPTDLRTDLLGVLA